MLPEVLSYLLWALKEGSGLALGLHLMVFPRVAWADPKPTLGVSSAYRWPAEEAQPQSPWAGCALGWVCMPPKIPFYLLASSRRPTVASRGPRPVRRRMLLTERLFYENLPPSGHFGVFPWCLCFCVCVGVCLWVCVCLPPLIRSYFRSCRSPVLDNFFESISYPDRNRGNQHDNDIAAEAMTMQDKH